MNTLCFAYINITSSCHLNLMSLLPQQITSFKWDKGGDQKSHKNPEEWDRYVTQANPRSRGSVKKLSCFITWMLWNSLMLPADDCICPSKLTSWTSLAETLHLVSIFILGISELIFLVQQRNLKETVSEKFQILEQIFESDWSKWERKPSMEEADSSYLISILLFTLGNGK